MNFIRRIFKRKQFKPEPKELRIDGCKTTLTPTPDDAELAAQALLESRIYGDKAAIKRAQRHAGMINAEREQARRDSGKTQVKQAKKAQAQQGTAAYYRQLSEKIRTARGQERRSAMRYVAYCEQELKMEDGRSKKEDG
ncbi:MAG: hypothetical protein IIZ73_09995, partial [Ruminococcus sp.]|nr:hypothetical protein [Ruminococcus sp.]